MPDMPRSKELEIRDALVAQITKIMEQASEEWPNMRMADMVTVFDEAKNRFVIDRSVLEVDAEEVDAEDDEDDEDDDDHGDDWRRKTRSQGG